MQQGNRTESDYVIVGAGAAGCVLGRRLSEGGKYSVTVLEAGGPDRNIFIKIPAGFMKTVYNRKLNWNYETAPAPHANNRSIIYPRGKVLGGSSSINGHLYVRGQAFDYDTWAQLGCRGWSWTDMLPLFKKSERRVGGDDSVRGRNGELFVEDQRSPHPLCELFQASAERIGLPRNPDYNSGEQEGTCVYQQMMRTGRRWSAADAFLKPALNRANLRLELHALAERVILEGKRAVGVAYRKDGALHEVRARREVILSGGSINSPQLLQLSGIGDPEWLKPHGIEVKHALNGVGKNLRDHYAARIACRVKNISTLNERARGLPLVQEVIRYGLTRKGLLTSAPGHAGGFMRSRPDLAVPDIQLFFAPASYAGGKVGTADLEREPGMTCGGYAARPESRGHVKLLSADPTKAPEIQTNYLADPLDQQITVATLKFVRKLFATKPIADYIVQEVFPGSQVKDEELLEHARATGSTTFHPIGSCKMGTDPMAVVDPQLKVIGLDGLRVADGSVMPTMVSGNTYAACVVIAEKAAQTILAAA
jgi:choline dehydrogenase